MGLHRIIAVATRRLALTAVVALALALGTGVAGAASNIDPPRPGQVGFVGQGQYGTFFKSGDLAKLFGGGGGYLVRARYRMRYERALGVSFERQGFDVRDPSDTTLAHASGVPGNPRTMTTIVSAIDYYQMFGTRTATVKYLSASVGLAQNTIKLDDGETVVNGTYAGDGFLVGVGMGFERYVWQSWAVDVSARYYAMFHLGHANHEVQLGLGMSFYAGY